MNLNQFKDPKKSKIIISTLILFGILLSFNQCVFKGSGPKSSVSSTQYGTSTVPGPNTGDASDINQNKDLPAGVDMPSMNSTSSSDTEGVEVGVKNFEQINMTMSQLTGIPTNNTNVQSVYNDIVVQLPTDNNLKSFLPSMQVAITKLATEYCDRLIEIGTMKATIWPQINFSQTPNQTLTSANKNQMITQTVEYFFGPISTSEQDAAKVELLSLYDSLITGESLTTNATTKKVVKGVCTAALSSAYVNLF